MTQEKIRQFEDLLKIKGRSTGEKFSSSELERLSRYYELVLKWNARLHLTTLTEPFTFFHRHVYESDFAGTFLEPSVKHLWDLGSGLGIPGIPLAIFRPDLNVTLVESTRGKAIFLEEVISLLNLENTHVVEKRFEHLGQLPFYSCLIARAVEQMGDMVAKMAVLGKNSRQVLLLGGESLAERLKVEFGASFRIQLIPIQNSERRFVISAVSST